VYYWVEIRCRYFDCLVPLLLIMSMVASGVHSQLSEGPLVRNVVMQIPKFDAKPNPSPSPNPNPMPIRQLEPWTSEPLDNWADTASGICTSVCMYVSYSQHGGDVDL